MQKVMQKVTCAQCGSQRLLFDAYVKWVPSDNDYSIVSVMDKPVICEDCDEEAHVNWNEVMA